MKRPKQTMKRYPRSLAVVCFLLVLFAAPLLILDRHDRLALQSAAVYAASADSYSLSTPVRLMTGPTIELESGTLSIPTGRTGLARGGQMIAMLITGSGPHLALENATFTADFSAREPTISREEPSGEIAPLVQALQGMQFGSLTVEDSTVRIKMSDGAIVELQSVDATISGKPNGAVSAIGSFNFRGERVEFDTFLDASLDAQGMSRPISASFASKPLRAIIDGSLMLGENPQLISPQAALTTADLRATARWLGVDWPSGNGFGAFRAKGPLEWVGRSISFQNAAVEFDENDANGTLSLNFAGQRPMIEGTLGLKTLDLTQYMKKDETQANPATLLAAAKNISGLALPLIDAVDADFRISSDRVALPATTIGRSAVTVSLRSGKLIADVAELEFDDGTRGGGQIRIDQNGAEPSYTIQAKFESPDVGRAIQSAFGHPTVQGRGSLTIDLTATGDTGDSLVRSLSGKLCATLIEGGRIGIDINTLTAGENATMPDGAWQQVSTNAISVDKLDARFVVTNGIMRAQSAEAVSGQRALKADGAISLIDHSIDMQLAVGDVAISTEGESNSGSDADNTETTTPVKMQPREIINMRGPWSSPAVQSVPVDSAQKSALSPPG
jgi:AsmA protein